MGKYNFSAQKFAELERRLEALEAANNELHKENAQLRAKFPADPVPQRCLRNSISNYDKVRELCGYAAKNGELVKTDDETIIGHNFTVFYQNVARIVAQVCYFEEKMKKSRIRGQNIADFSNNDYTVFAETVEAVVDTLYYAKKKMEGDTSDQS
jgi:hypothetical protein